MSDNRRRDPSGTSKSGTGRKVDESRMKNSNSGKKTGGTGNGNSKKRRAQQKRRKRRAKMAILVIEILVVLIAAIGVTLYFMPNSKAFLTRMFMKCPVGQAYLRNEYKDDYDDNVLDDSVNKDDIQKVDLGDGYTNIAFFGIDPRNGEFDSETHTDSIIIVSINNKTYDINMISLYRDSLLRIQDADGEIRYSKCNSAFFTSGAAGAMSMINTNLDLDITEYALVNFEGLATIIDALGGIDVTINESERDLINGYLVETREITGMDSPDVTDVGFVHLNGLQSTAYCRIRYTPFTQEDGTVLHDDYGRTARQRYVLNKILIHAKTAGISEILKVADTVIKKNNVNGRKILSTNMTWDRIEDLLTVAMECNLKGTVGFPFDSVTPDRGENYYGYVVPQGLCQNVTKLHAYMFGEQNYQPSQMVQNINDWLIRETNVYPPEPQTQMQPEAQQDQ